MKTLLLSLLLFCLRSSWIYAQEVGAGLKAGINFADQVTTGKGEGVVSNNRTGFHAGGYVNYFFNENAAVQAELLFSQKGSKWHDPYFNGQDRLHYLELPVLIKYRVYKFLSVHAGPQFAYLLSARNIPNEGEDIDASSYYKEGEVDLAFGVEASLPYNLALTVRYELGLSKVTTDVEYWEGWRNNVFLCSVGYRLAGK